MKTLGLLSFGLALGLSAQAALIQFELSPPGRGVGVGLSPSNTVPPAVGSTGSGDAISGGIVFDTDSRLLSVAVGYGSAAGFTDLTAPPSTMHIHGAGGPGTNANVQIILDTFRFPYQNAAMGGVIYGIVTVDSNDVSNLLAGLDYLDIHTTNFFEGELRGQLIAVVASNEPPILSCPPARTVQCGTASQISVMVSDPEGDAMNVLWIVNGVDIQTNAIPAGTAGATTNVSYTATFAFGVNSIEVIALDSGGHATACGTTVVVTDTNAPIIRKVTASPSILWPPNHKLVEVRVRADVEDCSSTTWKITGVTGNDSTSRDDWVILDDHRVKLRAERSGNHATRTYTITVRATDAGGRDSAPATVQVKVPHSGGHHDGR